MYVLHDLFHVLEKQRAQTAVDKMKELQSELAETRQKMANLAKQNSDQLTSQVVYPVLTY